MNTLNAYKTKISSGLIATLLIISSLVFLIPVVLPAHAANAQFSSALTYPYAAVGGGAATRAVSITDPLGNLGITEVDVSIPAAAAQAVTVGTFVDGFINQGGHAVAGSGPWTVVFSGATSGAVILPQGAAGHVSVSFTTEASETTPGTADTFSILVTIMYSDGSTQTQSLTLYEGRATTVTTALTSGTTFTAGSGVGLEATVGPSADSRIPLSFISTPSVSTVVGLGFSAAFSPASGVTGSTGKVDTTFVATEAGGYTAAGRIAAGVAADIGDLLAPTASPTFTYIPGAPTQVLVKIAAYDVAGVAVDYVSGAAAVPLGVALADQYGNDVTTGATGTVTLSVLAGTLSATTGTVTNGVLVTAITYTPTHLAALLSYGSFDLLSASLAIPAGSLAGTYTGSSKQMTIGYLSTTNVAAVTPTFAIYHTPYTGAGDVRAGTPVNVAYTFLGPQSNIPVNFTLHADPATGYTGTFSNGLSWIVVRTSSSGVATANFTADTTFGDDATVSMTVWEPTTASPTHTVSSLSTATITSGVSTPTSLKVSTYTDTALALPNSYTTPSGNLYLNVKLQDLYGNSVSWNSAFALQITLTASAGSGLSATTVYINQGKADTFGSGYQVQFNAAATIGTATIGAASTQHGINGITKTVYIVSPNPSVYVTAPTSTSLTANSQTVSGYGLPSPAGTTTLVQFTYSLNGAHNLTIPITATNSSGAAFFSFPVSLANGTNTLKIYAIDTGSNVGGKALSLTVTHPPPTTFANSIQIKGTPAKSLVGGYTGIKANYTNLWTTSQSVVVFAVWKNSAGQTVAVSTSGLTLAAGATGTAFMPLLAPLPSGTYTVNVFVWTTGNLPVSVTTPYTATV